MLRVKAYAKELQEQLREEYTGSDENITFEITEKGTATAEVLHPTSQEKIVFYLQNVPFGIQKMSGTIKGLVETSSNIGILRLDRDELFASSSVRSSVDAACSALSDKIEYLTEFLGGDYEVQGAYPAWEYRKESPLRDKMVAVFEEMYGHKPEVVAIHAGLECGFSIKKWKDWTVYPWTGYEGYPYIRGGSQHCFHRKSMELSCTGSQKSERLIPFGVYSNFYPGET